LEKRDKIKILYTIPNFDTAGSGKVVYDLVKGLDKDKFEVEVACSNSRGAFFKEMKSLGVPIHIMNTTTGYRPYSTLYSRIKTIKDFLKHHHYDIVHSWHWSSDWTEALAARWSGIKWIYTKKAMSWGNKHWRIRSFLANFIITINEEMHNYFPNKRNQRLIPLGIDTAYYSPQSFPEKSHTNKVFQIITVANLVPVKGIEVLIRAIKILKDEKITLTILGDNTNDYGNYLSKLSKELGIEQQVHFLGKKTEVRSYIAASNLYVIPTLNEGRKEGMPMALVEAMSMGVPVLGSDISGINFVLKDFQNLLFEAGNERLLAEHIVKMQSLLFQERTDLGDKLRAYVEKNFNEIIFLEAHKELYKELLK
jgi:glycosyltransferase involved in cell wall biosynthesis